MTSRFRIFPCLELLEDRYAPAVVNFNVPAVASGPGLVGGLFQVLARGTPQPNDDNVTTKKNFVSSDANFGVTDYIDIVFTLNNSEGISEYFIEFSVLNATSKYWVGFTAQLGFGTGSEFQMAPVLGLGGLNMDFYDQAQTTSPDSPLWVQIVKDHSQVTTVPFKV
jgi:hypothetical protein